MSGEEPRYTHRDPRSADQPGPGGQWRHREIVPRPGGTPQPDQTLIDVYIPPPDYQDSVGFTCDTYGNLANFVYDVAGYKYLTALVGVPSDATNAAGNAMTITFFKDGSTQLGQPITVSLDHPQSVHLPLQDASQLQISCNATNVTSHQPVDMDAALGNATIGPS